MKLMGLDVTGWHDVAARDWDIDAPDDRLPTFKTIDGGAGSVSVRDGTQRWLGGPQAALAPHGLGQGWGDLGGNDRRIQIADCYAALVGGRECVREAYAAGIESLTRHADEAVLNVADTPDYDEAARSRIITASRGKLRRIRLLWRPVALCLEALRTGLIGGEDVGSWFGFLIHSGDGFEFQRLRLREDSDHLGHYAPEREQYGVTFRTPLGLASLTSRLNDEIIRANPVLKEKSFGKIELAPRILGGRIAAGTRSVVRHDNRSWIEIRAPECPALPEGDELRILLSEALVKRGSISKLFFASPIAPDLAEKIVASLLPVQPECIRMHWESLAAGALQAGRIIEKGLPHYFDRLTPISLAVFQGDEPIFTDLLKGNATLPANKEYVSPPYRDLEWPRGKKEVEFNVLKADTEVRRWVVSVETPPATEMPVELIFRQTPGQSWAKLHLASEEWDVLQRSPVALDWEALHPSDESKDDVLKRLRKPPPTIPMRIVEPPTLEFWTGNRRYAGLRQVMGAQRFDLAAFAKLLPRSMRMRPEEERPAVRMWTIGTDGAFPDGLSETDISSFDRIARSLEAALASAIRARRPRPNNDELKALTWMFVRCPDGVQTAIVEALEADLKGHGHPLLAPPRARTVLLQGAGRAVTGVDRIRRVLRVLTAVEPFGTRKANNNTFSSLAMLLARRPEAPMALDPVSVGKIAAVVSAELSGLAQNRGTKGFQNRFKNALSALAGLFRYREVEPYALLRGTDQAATKLWDDLTLIRETLIARAANISQSETKIDLVGELIRHLEGRGDPNVLIRIEYSEESLEEDEEGE